MPQQLLYRANVSAALQQMRGKAVAKGVRAGAEFVRRFLLCTRPTGIKRIRHYGVLASARTAVNLASARQALQMPQANPRAVESAQGCMARVARMDVNVCPGSPLQGQVSILFI